MKLKNLLITLLSLAFVTYNFDMIATCGEKCCARKKTKKANKAVEQEQVSESKCKCGDGCTCGTNCQCGDKCTCK